MKKNIVFVVLICIFYSIFAVNSQTIEDKLLKKKERKILNYYFQAKARGRIPKLHVLESITAEIDSGDYTTDKPVDSTSVYFGKEKQIRAPLPDSGSTQI